MTSTENISKRPTNIRTDPIHLDKSGKSAQVNWGTELNVREGPALAKQLIATETAFSASIPCAVRITTEPNNSSI